MTIDGSILIGARDVRRDAVFHAVDAASGAALPQPFAEANEIDVTAACVLAEAAAEAIGTLAPDARAAFIEAVAVAIEAIGDVLIETAMAETGLPRARLEGERGRTTGQLRMFAAEVRDGGWLDAAIDLALPDRVPPRADLRRMNLPLGAVAVFGASNFPLAFSVAGGDTAAAFAAGCPVVVKGHPAHPGTGELAARAIVRAVEQCKLPAGTFAFLPGRSNELGAALVADHRIKAVGFTGSRSGGLALVEIAARRAEPIPVFAEMSSINPVVLLPAAMTARASRLGADFVASLTLGAGQFCTNPGLVIVHEGGGLEDFLEAARGALDVTMRQPMLTPQIEDAYLDGIASLEWNPAAARVDGGGPVHTSERPGGVLFQTTAAAFLNDKAFGREIFGAAAVIVRCSSFEDMHHVIQSLEGQLTATLHLDAADYQSSEPLLHLLQQKVGRILINGWPTGVEVTRAMVHGGPFPASSDGRSTSVGTLAMTRFLRPICMQDVPEALLPPPLKDGNPWNVPVCRDGQGSG
ncbi:aldehyde dehydrogenase (NADP(+)) [Novosphingobium sp.]|uniref:aldehyde dehydrogenase (NADP(+)) n=1 Tax=Novosphingobium sp. TaxID=1874826 RepID=UPI00286E3B16|nr:aldehyde dehydrogenase (NADP(+)) [Novosphingobium sp.]